MKAVRQQIGLGITGLGPPAANLADLPAGTAGSAVLTLPGMNLTY
jgi:hypothetical protein